MYKFLSYILIKNAYIFEHVERLDQIFIECLCSTSTSNSIY